MPKSKIQEKLDRHEQSKTEPLGKFRFRYGTGAFEVYCVRRDVEPPDSRRLTYPIARLYDNSVVMDVPWTAELLMDFLQPTLRAHRNTYGGQWHLAVCKAEPEPSPLDRPHGSRAETEALVLAGPDSPGQRWLLRVRAAQKDREALRAELAGTMHEVPAVEKPVTVATREQLEAFIAKQKAPRPLFDPHLPVPNPQAQPTPFDPKHDPELQGDLPIGREPGEEG